MNISHSKLQPDSVIAHEALEFMVNHVQDKNPQFVIVNANNVASYCPSESKRIEKDRFLEERAEYLKEAYEFFEERERERERKRQKIDANIQRQNIVQMREVTRDRSVDPWVMRLVAEVPRNMSTQLINEEIIRALGKNGRGKYTQTSFHILS